MRVDHHVDLPPDRVADGGDPVDVDGAGKGDLDARVAPREQFARALGRLRVTVDADMVAEAAAEQVPDRLAERLALDVPEGHLDPGHRAAADGPEHAVAHRGDEHPVPEPVDVARLLADEDRAEVLDRRLDHARPAGAFADARDALVGLDLDEQPVPRAAEIGLGLDPRLLPAGDGGASADLDEVGLDVDDLHAVSLPIGR